MNPMVKYRIDYEGIVADFKNGIISNDVLAKKYKCSRRSIRRVLLDFGLVKDRPGNSDRSICWECKNALLGCSWSKRFEPVTGWKATRFNNDNGEISYVVQKCPEFIPDDIR